MENNPNLYITVEYELFVKNSAGENEMIEKAPIEHPFQFISGFGTTLDAFEKNTAILNKGDKFDFTLSVDEAYGDYNKELIVELGRNVFERNGKFDTEHIFVGNVVPLMDADGHRYMATVTEIGQEKVTLDMNHPLAGKELHFKGSVVENREATKEEIQQMLNHMSGEGCGCGGNCGGCEGGGCEGGCEGGCGK